MAATRRRGERMLPLVYLGCTFLIVALGLPSILRPPPDQTTTSAEFSPDAPPEDEPEAIISALQQAGSAGAGGELTGPTTTLPPPELRPVRGKCFGDPPRQAESVYSPPCKEAFVGDNGGTTSKGVTGDEIKIAILPTLTGTTAYEGCFNDAPHAEDGANERTYRVLQEYFNTRYEFHGRKVVFCMVHGEDGESDGDTNERIKAQKADEVHNAFAAIHETSPASMNELARRKIVTITLGQVPGPYFTERSPYLWSFGPDLTKQIDMGAEYLCKKLAHKPPVFADDPSFDYTKERKFGIIAYNPPEYQSGPDFMRQLLRERCGVEVDDVIRYVIADASAEEAAQLTAGITQLKGAGVTTIIYLGDLISAAIFTPAATNNAYFPEWYIPGFGGVDVDDALPRVYDQEQWKNAFGFSFYEIPVADQARECNMAYRSIDPDNSPDDGMCTYMWQQFVRLLGGIQEAGPDLTPEAFKDAMYRLGYDEPDPEWRMAGGYGPGDHTYTEWATELWWDPDAIHPNGDTGAYRYVRGGKRYTFGGWPTEDTLAFQDGVTTRS